MSELQEVVHGENNLFAFIIDDVGKCTICVFGQPFGSTVYGICPQDLRKFDHTAPHAFQADFKAARPRGRVDSPTRHGHCDSSEHIYTRPIGSLHYRTSAKLHGSPRFLGELGRIKNVYDRLMLISRRQLRYTIHISHRQHVARETHNSVAIGPPIDILHRLCDHRRWPLTRTVRWTDPAPFGSLSPQAWAIHSWSPAARGPDEVHLARQPPRCAVPEGTEPGQTGRREPGRFFTRKHACDHLQNRLIR